MKVVEKQMSKVRGLDFLFSSEGISGYPTKLSNVVVVVVF